MNEKIIGTIEDYTKITTAEVTVPSGITFKVCALGAAAAVGLMSRMPTDGLSDEELIPFIVEHIEYLISTVIEPCIVEPRVPGSRLKFEDVMTLMNSIMTLSGFGRDETAEVESFHGEADDDSA